MAEVASTAVLEESNRFTEGKFTSPAATVEVGIFDVALKIPELKMSQLGLEIDVTDERGLVVANIGEGLFQRFNELYPTQALRIYDKILSANDVKQSAEMYKTMKSSLNEKKDLLMLSVSRPSRFEVTISSHGQLGMKLNYKNNSAGICITAITDGGLLDKWNKAHFDHQALPGDHIIALGGKEMRGLELIEGIKAEQAQTTPQEMRLTLLRYEK